VVIFIGINLQLVQVAWGIWKRKENIDVTGDPWNGRTLEWDTASPPPFYNFAHLPVVHSVEPHWDAKQAKAKHGEPAKRPYEAIHMPRNTGVGFIIGIFAFVFSFGMIWDIWWLAIVTAVAMFIGVVYRSFDYDIDYYVTPEEVERIENEISNRNKA